MNDGLILRELSGVPELLQAEAFQIEVWGAGEKPDPSDIMLALQHEGALVAGAFRGDRMLAFLFAFPTATPGVQHSHRLAVHADARGLGLGARMKWYQRDWCLARGITEVRWTYDPMRAINAGLNIGVLGATANQYFVNYYGDMPGINAGLPSDRILAQWRLDFPGVAARSKDQTPVVPAGCSRVEIPADLDALVASDPDRALAERLRIRAALQGAFAAGQQIAGFDRASRSYLLVG
jgi:predicted GNAT superfamily acetyltransferase